MLSTAIVQVYKTPSTLHSASVNGIAFGPQELGLVLACASSDGSVSVVEHQQDGTWTSSKVKGFAAATTEGMDWPLLQHQLCLRTVTQLSHCLWALPRSNRRRSGISGGTACPDSPHFQHCLDYAASCAALMLSHSPAEVSLSVRYKGMSRLPLHGFG